MSSSSSSSHHHLVAPPWLGTGSFACYHGEEGKRPHPDESAKIITSIKRLYDEAARRLPIDEITELVGCIFEGGHCLGLADPVGNIILNAIAHHASGRAAAAPHLALPREEGKSLWGILAARSYAGLVAFMSSYFRLFLHDRRRRCQRPRLLPDGGKIKAALRVAALKAAHPAPDELARLMTAQFPAGSELLTAGDVMDIKNLLGHQWPQVNIDFLRRPYGLGGGQDGTVTLRTTIGEDGRVALITIAADASRIDSPQLGYISDLTFDCETMEAKLSRRLAGVTRAADDGDEAAGAALNYDLSPCEHILSLKMCLLDAIHGFYIRALAVLPAGDGWTTTRRRGRFIRSLLAAGHCYGPLDPASNIILNTVWYDAAAPPPPDDEADLPGDIFDTDAMLRVECRSLDGLVAAVRAVAAAAGKPISEHEAIEHLWSRQCDLTEILQNSSREKKRNPYAAAGEASDHPQSAMIGSFLVSLSGENLDCLRQWLKPARDFGSSGCVISDVDWEKLNTMIHGHQPIRGLKRKRSSSENPLNTQALSEISTERALFWSSSWYLQPFRQINFMLLFFFAGNFLLLNLFLYVSFLLKNCSTKSTIVVASNDPWSDAVVAEDNYRSAATAVADDPWSTAVTADNSWNAAVVAADNNSWSTVVASQDWWSAP
uniref:PIR2-like helical domain-containing protein n=1 Tax=Oryza nivara TaxID=4536 RepID=A0A0E0GWS4_ORYNI